MALPPLAEPNESRTAFLRLPLKIRQWIYSLVLYRPMPILVFVDIPGGANCTQPTDRCPDLDLLYTNRQISEEAACLFYQTNTFSFYGNRYGSIFPTSRVWAVLHLFLCTIGERNCGYLRHISITIPSTEIVPVTPWGIPVEPVRPGQLWNSSVLEWKPILPPVFSVTMKMMSKILGLTLDFYFTDEDCRLKDDKDWEEIMVLLKENPEGPKVRFVMDSNSLRLAVGRIPPWRMAERYSEFKLALPSDRGQELVVVEETNYSRLGGYTLVLRDGHYTIADGPKAGQRLTFE